MDESKDDILQRLEGSIADWSAEVDDAHHGLARRIASARGRLGAFMERVGDGEEAVASAAALASAQEDVEALERNLAELELENEGLREQLGELESRAAQVERELEERAEAEAKAGLAHRLSEALRDRREAQEEIARLKHELEAVQDVSPPDSSPHQDGGSEELTQEEFVAEDSAEGNDRKLLLGELLVRARVLTPGQLEAALAIQRNTPHRPLGEILVEVGYVTDEAIARALAVQLQVPFVNLEEEDIDEEAVALLTTRLAIHHACIPIEAESGRLTLAMANPLNLIAIEDIERATSHRVDVVVAPASQIVGAIGQHYEIR